MLGGSHIGQQTDVPFGGMKEGLGTMALGLGMAGLGPCIFQDRRREASGTLRYTLAMAAELALQLCGSDREGGWPGGGGRHAI